MDYRDRTFENQDVLLDGNVFTACTFRNVTFVYGGGEMPHMTENHIDQFRVRFTDAAERTVQMLMGFQHGMGAPGARVVDEFVANIRRGRPRAR